IRWLRGSMSIRRALAPTVRRRLG
ncbi:uncharacterized protein METZ01_LOCUS247370, partial [marine metagenome]